MTAMPITSTALVRLKATGRAALAQWLLGLAMKADTREVVSTVARGVADAEERLGVPPGSYGSAVK